VKSKCFLGAFMGGWIILGLYLSAGAVQFSEKNKPLNAVKPAARKKTSTTSTQPRQSLSKNPIKSLPALGIEKIWLDRQNIIHFTLKNRGKGTLSAVQHAKGKVRVSFGSASRTFNLKAVDPNQLLKRPGGTVSFNAHITVTQAVNVKVKIFFPGRKPEISLKSNPLTIRLNPRLPRIAPQTKTEMPSTQQTVKRSELTIGKIYLKNGTLHVRIKNIGRRHLTKTDLDPVRLRITLNGKTFQRRMTGANVPFMTLHPQGTFDVDTGLRIEKKTRVTARLDGIRATRGLGQTVFISPGPGTRSLAPDFSWVKIDGCCDSRPPSLINLGGDFVGTLLVQYRAIGFPNIHQSERMIFRRESPFKHGQIIPTHFTTTFLWPPEACTIYLIFEADPANTIHEISETNNNLVVEQFPPAGSERLKLTDEAIYLESGRASWVIGKDTIEIEMRRGANIAKPNIVLMDVKFTVSNCSRTKRTLNPHIRYIGQMGKDKVLHLGLVEINPGEEKVFSARIQLNIFFDPKINNHVHVALWEGKSLGARVVFTNDFLASLKGRCLYRLYHPESVVLGFSRGTKTLTNGGTVTLQKGEWVGLYREEYAIDLIVKVRLKACKPCDTDLIFKTLCYGRDFTRKKRVKFEPENEFEISETVKIRPAPWKGLGRPSYLQIIDASTGERIFNGAIRFSDALMKEIGWGPLLYLSQDPIVYIHSPREGLATIKCFVQNAGGESKDEIWGLDLEIKYGSHIVEKKTYRFKGVSSRKFITHDFAVRYYDGYTYKLSLWARNENILLYADPEHLVKFGYLKEGHR